MALNYSICVPDIEGADVAVSVMSGPSLISFGAVFEGVYVCCVEDAWANGASLSLSLSLTHTHTHTHTHTLSGGLVMRSAVD